MKNFSLFSLTIVALLCTQAFSDLSILNPPALKSWWDANPQNTHTSISAFGYIPWGRKIIGSLKLAEPLDACDYIRQGDEDFLQHSILVASRGGCPFVVKAHYAQLAGAKMLLIADNAYEEVQQHLMVDQMGQGDSVNIPAALLSKQAGDKLIDSLKNGDPKINKITAVFDFPLQKSDEVEYHIWLSSATTQSFKFINEWRSFDQKISNYATLVPHYAHFFSDGQEAELAKSPDCICGGRYCAPDPDDDRENTGADVLLEDIRQMCIINVYSMDTWWNYIQHFDTFCLTGGDMAKCATNTLLNLKLDQNSIQRCIDNSFNTNDMKTCTKNKLLDNEREKMAKDAVFIFPSVVINGFMYRGNLLPARGVFEAICETFNSMPAVCRRFIRENDSNNYITEPTSNHAPILISAFVFLLLFSMFVFCCYRRYLKREMYKQMVRDVNIAVSQYIAFKDESMTEDREDHNLATK